MKKTYKITGSNKFGSTLTSEFNSLTEAREALNQKRSDAFRNRHDKQYLSDNYLIDITTSGFSL